MNPLMSSFQYTSFVIDSVNRILRNLQDLEQDFAATEFECYQLIQINNTQFRIDDLLTTVVKHDILTLLVNEYHNNLLINNRKFECEFSRSRAIKMLSELIDILQKW